jgi:hypothetical protein
MFKVKIERWQILFAISLVFLSILFYLITYDIFGDEHDILSRLAEEISFLPLEVLLVALIIEKIFSYMEKRNRMEKLNMVIGTFFIEVGTKLLIYLSDFDPELESIRSSLVVKDSWSDQEFSRVSRNLDSYNFGIDMEKVNLEYLLEFLQKNRDFLLRLTENPTLLEHESFTDVLLAITHLSEELASRPNLKDLPQIDLMHLQGDIKRVYGFLVHEWLDYMKYLKVNYPYLFSLAMRTNPFDQTASPILRPKPT